jgi:Uncharacterised nucleotidyltransferase
VTPWPDKAGPEANDKRATWAMHMAARTALLAATKLLEEAGVPSVAVKGVVTAYWLYEDPTERPIGDVDLRIRPEDFRRAARAFRAAGWRIVDWKPAYGAFVAQLRGVCVDVESVIGAPGLCGLSVAEMMGRAAEVDGRSGSGLGAFVGVGVGKTEARVRVPETHDHAVVLTVNVFKDKLRAAAPWAIEDVRRVVGAPGFDTGRFIDVARRGQVAGIAWIIADWMGRELGSDRWARIREGLGGESGPRPVYSWVFRWLLGREVGPKAEGLGLRLVTRLGRDGVGAWTGAGALGKAMIFECGRSKSKRRRHSPKE